MSTTLQIIFNLLVLHGYDYVSALSVVNSTALDVLVMGDWGGSSLAIFDHVTPQEVSSAHFMNIQASANENVSMVWGLGDNFYLLGVENEYDERFESTFESVFNTSSLIDLPFYFVAGNHDHYGNVSGQIAYSAHNKRWIYPDYNYSKVWQVLDTESNTNYTVQLVMIDTIILCGNTQDVEYCSYKNISDCRLKPELKASDIQSAEDQWQWLNYTLRESSADILIVAGHFPIWSIAEHGPTECLVERLRPMLIEYQVNVYLCGHDHTFELIVEDEYPDILYAIVGGTHVCQMSTAHVNDIPENSLKFHGCKYGGFAQLQTNSGGFQLKYFFGNSTDVQYSTDVYSFRKANK